MPFTPAPSAAARPPPGTSRGLPPPIAARPVTAAPAPTATVRPTPPASIYAAPAPTAAAPKPPPIATNSLYGAPAPLTAPPAVNPSYTATDLYSANPASAAAPPPIFGAPAAPPPPTKVYGADPATSTTRAATQAEAALFGATGHQRSQAAEVLGQPTATNEVNWLELSTHLPFGRGAAERAARDELWRRLDEAGNGYLSLAELDKGMRTALRVDHVFAARPVLMRAFQVAKRAAEPHARLGPDFVERGVEFRAVLHQLRRYLEVFAMFHRMDANDDRRVSLEDFELAVPLLVTWRVNPKEAKAKFLEADRAAAKGGIRFDEFVLWAMRLAPEKADEYDDDSSHHAARDDEIKAAFEFFDRNRSGHLEHRELRNALAHLRCDTGGAAAVEALRPYDNKPDGRLDLQGFERVVREMEARRGVGVRHLSAPLPPAFAALSDAALAKLRITRPVGATVAPPPPGRWAPRRAASAGRARSGGRAPAAAPAARKPPPHAPGFSGPHKKVHPRPFESDGRAQSAGRLKPTRDDPYKSHDPFAKPPPPPVPGAPPAGSKGGAAGFLSGGGGPSNIFGGLVGGGGAAAAPYGVGGLSAPRYGACGDVRDASGAQVGAAAHMNAAEMIYVRIPPGVKPGEQFLTRAPNGSQLAVEVPPNCQPGQTVAVELPAAARVGAAGGASERLPGEPLPPGAARRPPRLYNATGDAKSALSTDPSTRGCHPSRRATTARCRRRRPPSTARSAATALQRRACVRATSGARRRSARRRPERRSATRGGAAAPTRRRATRSSRRRRRGRSEGRTRSSSSKATRPTARTRGTASAPKKTRAPPPPPPAPAPAPARATGSGERVAGGAGGDGGGADAGGDVRMDEGRRSAAARPRAPRRQCAGRRARGGVASAIPCGPQHPEVGGGGEESLRRPEPEAGRRSARRQPEGSDGHQPERGAAERREAQPAGLRGK